MKVNTLKNPQINQNGYHKNLLTKERIGTLFIYPIDFTPDDCLSCEGYSLQISDYEDLYKVIGTKFNKSGDASGTFRIPDYNVTGRFLQPSQNAGELIEAGLPQHTHSGTSSSNGAHTHTRGTMDIKGSFVNSGMEGNFANTSSGAIVSDSLSYTGYYHSSGRSTWSGGFNFQASRNWTGATSSNGAHTHTITVGNASDSNYGKSTTVQPPSQLVHICIKYK